MAITNAKRFTCEEYHWLTEKGFFQDGSRVELLQGEIIKMAAKGTLHTTVNRRLLRELHRLIADRATIQNQDPIILANDGEPEPDITIVRNREDDYLTGHPTVADILLVIEIADSSLNYDRQVKLSNYAASSISHYWIFNLLDLCLESYQAPYQKRNQEFDYQIKQVFLPNQSVTLPPFPDLLLDLTRVFPPDRTTV